MANIRDNMEIVRKTLEFINDKDLQVIIKQRIDELEKTVSVNANLSTIILSIGCIEGIFKYTASIFKTEIMNSTNYPKKKDGSNQRFSKLRIEKIYELLVERDILQKIENFVHIYNVFRIYRNFVHPQRQQRESWPVGLGEAQMALGLLNMTIDQISKYIFIGPEIFETVSGTPKFDLSKVLHLDTAIKRTHSFLVLKQKIDSDLNLKCDLNLSENAILNFVFNFDDDSNFKMLRLDNRDLDGTPNALLYSKQKSRWYIVATADQKQPPQGVIKLEININTKKKQFLFNVNGQAYKFFKKSGEEVDLFRELRKGLRIGWFNEVAPVEISNIEIKL